MGEVRDFQDILADIRGECVSAMASIQLLNRGTYTDVQTFIKVIRSLNNIVELVTECEKMLVLKKNNSEIWNE